VLNVDHPEHAVSIGQHINSEGVLGDTDAVQTLLTYPGNIQMHFEGMFSNARNGARIEFRNSSLNPCGPRRLPGYFPERLSKVPASELILGTGPRGADFYDTPDGELVHTDQLGRLHPQPSTADRLRLKRESRPRPLLIWRTWPCATEAPPDGQISSSRRVRFSKCQMNRLSSRRLNYCEFAAK